MIDIKLEENSSIVLEMHINGDVDKSKAELRLSVISEGVRYSFTGTKSGKDNYEVRFPKMLGRIDEGQYPAEIEILIDGKHFVPLTETINFTKEIKPTVKLSERAPDKEIAVTMKRISSPIVEKIVSADNVKSLLVSLVRDKKLNTIIALEGMEALIARRKIMLENVSVNGNKSVSENDVVAGLQMIQKYGDEIPANFNSRLTGMLAMSQRVIDQLSETLVDKGITTKALRKIS